MLILRQNFFSKSKKDEEEQDARDRAKMGAAALGGAGLLLGTEKLSKKVHKKSMKVLDDGIEGMKSSKSAKALNEKLKDHAKKSGVKIIEDKDFENSAYMGGGRIGSAARKWWNKKKKVDPEDAKEIKEQIKRGAKVQTGMSYDSLKELGNDTIVMGKGADNPAVLAHEIGHSSMDMFGKKTRGRSKDVVGKLAHELGPASKIASMTDSKLVKGAYAAGGFRRGKNSVTTDEEGNIKVNKKKLLKSAGIGLATAAPVMIMEGAASRKGLKLMKHYGADKETIKNSRKLLGGALGTYASIAMKPAMYETGGHLAGVAYGVARERKKKKDKRED